MEGSGENAIEKVFTSTMSNINMVITQLTEQDISRPPPPDFALLKFWGNLSASTSLVAKDCTVLCLAFAEPPLPNEQDCVQLCGCVERSILSMVSVFYGLPHNQGMELYKQTKKAVLNISQAVHNLLSVIKQEGCSSVKITTGTVWEACDKIPSLNKDNKSATLSVCRENSSLVTDALQEFEQSIKKSRDSISEEGSVMSDLDEGHWSEQDYTLLTPVQGLIKVARSCLKKLTESIKSQGSVESATNVQQLDSVCTGVREVSPCVDDLLSVTYPPMSHDNVKIQAEKLCSILKNILSQLKGTHFVTENDQTWVEFLEKAISHNIEKLLSTTTS